MLASGGNGRVGKSLPIGSPLTTTKAQRLRQATSEKDRETVALWAKIALIREGLNELLADRLALKDDGWAALPRAGSSLQGAALKEGNWRRVTTLL